MSKQPLHQSMANQYLQIMMDKDLDTKSFQFASLMWNVMNAEAKAAAIETHTSIYKQFVESLDKESVQ